MKNLLIILLCISSFNIFSQGIECGTKVKGAPIIFSKKQTDSLNSILAINTPYSIKIYVTVFANDNGSNRAATDEDIHRQIQNMTNQYAGHNICFLLAGLRQVNNTDLNDQNITGVTATDETTELNQYIIPGYLNIFIHQTMPDLFGIAYDIPSQLLSMRSDAIASINQISILAHEMGHCLGLYHTFEPWESTTTGLPTNLENVARAGICKNCTTAGDVLCDTPADNNGSYNTNTCTYTGTNLDPCNVGYNPLTNNIMSYYNFCSNTFTSEQGTRMRSFLLSNPILNSFIATDILYLPNAPNLSSNSNSGIRFEAARDFIGFSQFANNIYDVSGSSNHLIISRKVSLKPGTRLHPTTGRIVIKANPFCN